MAAIKTITRAESRVSKTLVFRPLAANFTRNELPALLPLLAALAISLLPVYLWARSIGAWAYIADADNQYYLQLAAQAFYFHPWYISDPVRVNEISPFPWLQFVPASALAKALGMSVLDINIVWLVFAACGVGLGFYILFRQFETPWAAAGCAIFMIAGSEPMYGQPLIRQLTNFARVVSGHQGELFKYGTGLFQQFRVVHPGLTLPFLLLLISIVAYARRRAQPWRYATAGIALGLLFYVSFYEWTAALFALALVCILDSEYRRLYLWIICLGAVLGIPSLLWGMHTRAAAIGLPRISLFLPIPRLSYFVIPKGILLLLAITGLWLTVRARRDLVFLWSTALAALLLVDSHVITGLQLHNTHWILIAGPLSIALLLIMVVAEARSRLGSHVRTKAALAAFLIVYFAIGMYLRAAAAMNTGEGLEIRHAYSEYVEQRKGPEVKPLDAGSVIAGDIRFCDLATIIEKQHPLAGYAALQSAPMSDDEWESRVALNKYLEGDSLTDFTRYARRFAATNQWGRGSMGERARSALAASLIRHYDEVSRNPSALLMRFDVRYVVLPLGQPLPQYLSRGWSVVQPGPFWSVWDKRLSLN
jgi:hypothetical protein